jgi:cytochrome c5
MASDTPPAWMRHGMMMDMMADMPRGIPERDLPDPGSRGARLVASYCSQCHGIPSPRTHSAADWVPTARRMFLRMEHMSRMGGMMGHGMSMGMSRISPPSRDEEGAILDYLRANAFRSTTVEALPESTHPDAALFARMCSRCHALPDPTQHTSAEWAAVVARMRQNMRTMGVREVTDEEAAAIIGYLQHAARR